MCRNGEKTTEIHLDEVTSIERRTSEYAITRLKLNFRAQIAHAQVVTLNIKLKKKSLWALFKTDFLSNIS